jgi:prepilin-type N-terminal cleavage/methylation domain-containing protein
MMRTQGTSIKADPLERAFSLIEIMVAVTLLAVITVGLLSMFYHTQKAFRLGAGQVDVLEGGRSTMHLLSQDLQEMYPSHVAQVANFEALPVGNARLDMDLPGGGYRTNLVQDISFISRHGDEWIGITYRVSHNGLGAGTLYRSVISTNPSLPHSTTPLPEWMVVSNLFRDTTNFAVLSPDPTVHDPDFHRIADGIVHLRVRGAYDNRGRLYPEAVPGVYGFTNEVPAYLDLELAILDPKGVSQFEARTNAPATARAYLAGQVHRVHLFTQRVPIRSSRSPFDLFASPQF